MPVRARIRGAGHGEYASRAGLAWAAVLTIRCLCPSGAVGTQQNLRAASVEPRWWRTPEVPTGFTRALIAHRDAVPTADACHIGTGRGTSDARWVCESRNGLRHGAARIVAPTTVARPMVAHKRGAVNSAVGHGAQSLSNDGMVASSSSRPSRRCDALRACGTDDPLPRSAHTRPCLGWDTARGD